MRRLWVALVVVACASLASGALFDLTATLGSSAPQERQLRTLSPKDVAAIQSVGTVAIRPDGSMIAYTLNVPREPGRDEDGRAYSEIHVVRFDGSADRPYVPGAVNASHLRWSPDGRYLAYLARRDGDDHTSLYVIPSEAGESRRLYQHVTAIESFEWRPDGQALAFIARAPVPADLKELREKGFDQEIYEEDWRARHVHVLELPDGPEGEPGGLHTLDGLPGHAWHVAWSPDGTRLVTDLSPAPLVDDRYMFRRLHVVEAATGSLVAKIENPGKLGEFGWSPDGRTIALVSGVDIHDPREGRLMVVDAAGGQLRDLTPDLNGHVTAFEFTPNGRILYLADVGVGSRIARLRMDGRGETLYEGTEPVANALSLDAKGQRVALVAGTAESPEEVYAVRAERRASPSRLTNHNPWLDEVQLGRQEIVRWTARDGLEIEGLLIRPVQRREGERVPTIVVAHGGPESHYSNGWLTSYSRPGQVAAGRGYAVFYPNYRGSTGRGVEFAKADQGDGMGAEFNDVLDGVDYLVERGIADPDRVGITGGSYGGYFTAWAATRHSERFAAGVMFVGVSDQLSKTLTSDIPRELELVHWLTNPLDDLELFLERSPILHVENAQTPLLILHGKEDPRVYPGQSLELYRALEMKGDAPVRLVLYPGEGHGNRRAASRYDYNLRMLRWFDHFLKARGTELPPWRIDYDLPTEETATGANGR